MYGAVLPLCTFLMPTPLIVIKKKIMKWSSSLFKAAILGSLLTLATACEQECNCPDNTIENPKLTREPDNARPVRERLVSLVSNEVRQLPAVNRFVLSPAMIADKKRPQPLELLSDEAIENREEAYANVQAAELVTSIFNALIAAESSANLLDVNLSFSEEAIENNTFVFAIEAPKSQRLDFTMYDEEGFDLVASNGFDVNEGNNYKALNVSSLAPGTYIFKLKNETEGKELVRRLEIAEKE